MLKSPELIEVLESCVDDDTPAMVIGESGIGKSDVIGALAKKRDAAFYDVRLSMYDPTDLRGLPTIQNGETVWMRPGVWPKDMSRETFLFFDEMDRATPSVLGSALQIVLNRRVGEHTLPDTVRILAAGNGKNDRGTTRFPEALAKRFAWFEMVCDKDAWISWAEGNGMHPLLIAFMDFRGNELLSARIKDGEFTAPSPRQWAEFNKSIKLADALRARKCAALVGESAATEFEGFFRLVRDLPSIRDILSNPSGAIVPAAKDISQLFAVAYGVAREATSANMDAVLTYAKRLPSPEYTTALVSNAVRIDKVKRDLGERSERESIMNTRAYIEYAATKGA